MRTLMTCRREQYELLEREARAKHGDKVNDAMFDDLDSKVRGYAQQRRLEELTKKARGDPMDIRQLKQSWDEWYQEGQDGRMQDNYGLDALGKGKGLTKGKSKGWSKGKSDGFRTAPQQLEQTHNGVPRPTAKAKEKERDRCAGTAESKGTHKDFLPTVVPRVNQRR